jgi:adenylate cyclase
LIEPRARELLTSLAVIVVICSVFGAISGMAMALPAGQTATLGAFRGVVTGLLVGTSIGGLETLFDRGSLMWRIRRLALPWIMLIRLIFYIISAAAGVMAGRLLSAYVFEIPQDSTALDADFWGGFILTSGFGLLLLMAYKAAPIVGARTLWKVFLGLYMKPRSEELTIVFMDLIGSTRLTEHIGDAGFMRFLNDAIFELTRPIVRNGGSIYRYVGDEIIITWPAKDATRAVQCVFEMEEALRERRPHFEKQFNASPRFRYGMHVGQVMVGELGDLRVEIAMIGDAINTTKRIEDACRQFDFSVMASSKLLGMAVLPEHIHAVPVEELAVRGKAKKLQLCGLVHSTHRLVSNPRIQMSDYAQLGEKDTIPLR